MSPSDAIMDEYVKLKRRYDALLVENERLLTLWYMRDPVEVARLCDEKLDRSGVLLGQIRALARDAATEEQTP